MFITLSAKNIFWFLIPIFKPENKAKVGFTMSYVSTIA